MKQQELVSVVVPVYNVEKYIGKCLESLRAQTYKNIEIIAVDDSSPDGSAKVIKHFADIDSRVRYILRDNGGLGAARNTGIEASRGSYICFVDSDDWVRTDYIQKFMAAAVSDTSDIVISNIKYIFGDTSILPRTPHIDQHEVITSKEPLAREFVGHQYKFHAPNKFCKRTLFIKEKIRFPEGKLYEDVFTTYKLLRDAQRISLIPDFTYYYLQDRSDSIMNTDIHPQRFYDMFEALKQIITDPKIQIYSFNEEVQCLYVESIVALVDYLVVRNTRLPHATIRHYRDILHADSNVTMLVNGVLSNSHLSPVSKIRAIAIYRFFSTYCWLLRMKNEISKVRCSKTPIL